MTNNLLEKAKSWTRSVLLKFARKLKTENDKGPVVRNARNLFSREIKIPIVVSLTFTVIAICCMFVIGLGVSYKTMLATAIFVAGVVFFIVRTQSVEKAILKDNDAVVLICLLFIIAVLTFQISKEYISPLASPVSVFTLIATMLLSLRIGIMYAVSLSLFVAFLNDMRFDVFLVMLCSSVAVMTNVQNIRRRADFVNVSFKTIAAAAAVITVFYFFDKYDISQFIRNLFYGILNGAFAIILLPVFIPLFEKLFSRTTNIKLIELSDFNNLLLKRLMLEAPGTYHHSIMTADIAEQAANVIDADSLLARVGAYYHDIGKLIKPQYFIENQVSNHNPHDELSPTMSSLILVSHVKEGVALSKKYNIDNEIINIIEQHHGTTSIHAFYHRALEQSPETDIENFRYPGPKPTTKVSAIVMIADSSEAACRSIEEPTVVKIKDMVEKIINNKFIDEQFSNCPITLKDLKAIRDSVISTLIGIYHARIEYKDKKE
ncbi:MAG: HDIG domain-containing protein [Endomicrobium sp.]|jgi:putative nucleotidyltransferase with HDIG domain|nr:HDIG domain-containing protein [Endomicrobium sp.]